MSNSINNNQPIISSAYNISLEDLNTTNHPALNDDYSMSMEDIDASELMLQQSFAYINNICKDFQKACLDNN